MIKVCGMRDAENIREVEALGIDLMGFIFWPKSSRYVSDCPSYLPSNVKRVGVFVNENIEKVKQTAHDYALDFIQLHGSESPEYCTMLKGHHLIKAFKRTLPRPRPMKDLLTTFFSIQKEKALVAMVKNLIGLSSLPMIATRPFSSAAASDLMMQNM